MKILRPWLKKDSPKLNSAPLTLHFSAFVEIFSENIQTSLGDMNGVVKISKTPLNIL